MYNSLYHTPYELHIPDKNVLFITAAQLVYKVKWAGKSKRPKSVTYRDFPCTPVGS